jgi:anti-anti-sigma factor
VTDLDVATERVGNGTVLLVVTGEVDLESAPEFDRHLHAALDSGVSTVIVDLTECEFFDSSGLNVLARANHRHDGVQRLSLIAPRESFPRRVIEITQLDHMFRIYPERYTALKAAATHSNSDLEAHDHG